MDFFTHILMGILIPIPLLGHIPPETIIFIWLMSFLPDFDIILEPIQRKTKNYMFSHKAASHSIIIGFIFTGCISFVMKLFYPNMSIFFAWLGGIIGYSMHTFLDFFASSKIPIFYPITRKEYRFLGDKAVNPLLALISIVNNLILIIFFIFRANISIFYVLFYIFILSYITYFGYRAIVKLYIQYKLPKNSLFIPEINPIFYMIYTFKESEEVIDYRLIKKRILSSKSKELIHKSYNVDSIEIEFFQKAIEYSKSYRFFYKWNAIIPLFKYENGCIKVKIILAEAFSRKRSYTITIIFDKNTKEILKKDENFKSLKDWDLN